MNYILGKNFNAINKANLNFRGGDEFCGHIKSTSSVFADCSSHLLVNLQGFFDECVFDLCVTNGNIETFSQVFNLNQAG